MIARDFVDGACRTVGLVVISYALYVVSAAIINIKLPEQVANDANTIELMHLCFPGGYYQADAAPVCPDIHRIILNELTKQTEEKFNAK